MSFDELVALREEDNFRHPDFSGLMAQTFST